MHRLCEYENEANDDEAEEIPGLMYSVGYMIVGRVALLETDPGGAKVLQYNTVVQGQVSATARFEVWRRETEKLGQDKGPRRQADRVQ